MLQTIRFSDVSDYSAQLSVMALASWLLMFDRSISMIEEANVESVGVILMVSLTTIMHEVTS